MTVMQMLTILAVSWASFLLGYTVRGWKVASQGQEGGTNG